ncbi:hypothetical protein F5144DRAFT_547351 [Chaetomium tenue]|uniref:Uncharacterized protein n=1 Tax=Chaetomium tenue TaxID=1854479 RepID=A0ACB7P8P9_9PEZI|nr:hypothetical protein F5144DRAFT_547351 [Chaetomium globosum]
MFSESTSFCGPISGDPLEFFRAPRAASQDMFSGSTPFCGPISGDPLEFFRAPRAASHAQPAASRGVSGKPGPLPSRSMSTQATTARDAKPPTPQRPAADETETHGDLDTQPHGEPAVSETQAPSTSGSGEAYTVPGTQYSTRGQKRKQPSEAESVSPDTAQKRARIEVIPSPEGPPGNQLALRPLAESSSGEWDSFNPIPALHNRAVENSQVNPVDVPPRAESSPANPISTGRIELGCPHGKQRFDDAAIN